MLRYLFSGLLLFLCCDACAMGPCFPKTDIKITAEMTATGIAESEFNEDLDLLQVHYQDEVKLHGATLVINRQWEDPTVNSDTYESDGKWVINSYGGLARYRGMTKDGYLAVACHELGHHLGGVPKYSDDPWASVEGEADYFATKRCLKEIGLSKKRVEAASMSLARVLADLGGEPVPKPSTPDKSKVKETYEEHPAAQCRLDTYLNGGKCKKKGPLSDSDPKVNACWGYSPRLKVGVRPRCWFKP